MQEETKQKIKDKIIEANKSINKREILYRCNRDWDAWRIKTMTEDDFEEVEIELTLADVLLAIKTPYTLYKCLERNKTNYILIVSDDIRIYWNLQKPLDDQPDEVLTLLEKLLLSK